MDCKSCDVTQPEVSINWLKHGERVQQISRTLISRMAQSSTLISYYTIVKLFEDDIKLLKRGENALRSGHLESCLYDSTSRVINGKVHASVRDKIYNVEVRPRQHFTCVIVLIGRIKVGVTCNFD